MTLRQVPQMCHKHIQCPVVIECQLRVYRFFRSRSTARIRFTFSGSSPVSM